MKPDAEAPCPGCGIAEPCLRCPGHCPLCVSSAKRPRDPSGQIAKSLAAVPPDAWNACAFPGPRGEEDPHNPFLSHAFLSALEESGCVGRRTGWPPLHLLVEERRSGFSRAAPCYMKSHSRANTSSTMPGRDAFERAGGRYYPKLQVSVPFTPVTGPRLLVRPGPDATARATPDRRRPGALARQRRLLGPRHLPAPRTIGSARRATGFLQPHDQQFHWINDGYGSFEDFLGALSSRKRKAIRRERRDALADGSTIAG